MKSLNRRRTIAIRAGVALMILVGALVCAGVDDVFLHAAPPATFIPSRPENPGPHIASGQAVKESPACSICFFHKALGQSVLPLTHFALPSSFSTRSFERLYASLSRLSLTADFIRGPPSLD
jgi:hypothetical protein